MGKGARLRLLKLAAAPKVKAELSAGTVDEQVGRLNELPDEIMQKASSKGGRKLKETAFKEMDKEVRKLKARGETVTLDRLLKEVKTPGFLTMSERLGVPYQFYEDLAKERMKAHGL